MKVPVYIFRENVFAAAGDTVVSAAPLDAVVAVYGGGGIKQSGGLSKVFGGVAVYRDGPDRPHFLAVWGARKASKFRNTLRKAGLELQIVDSPPPARLAWYETKNLRLGTRSENIEDER